jgi:hypothetical protein
MIYIPNVWLKFCPKRLLLPNRREYLHVSVPIDVSSGVDGDVVWVTIWRGFFFRIYDMNITELHHVLRMYRGTILACKWPNRCFQWCRWWRSVSYYMTWIFFGYMTWISCMLMKWRGNVFSINGVHPCSDLGPFAPLVRVCFGDKWQPYACD